MANNPLDQLKDVLSAPLGELISSIGKGVGAAQAALDEAALQQTLAIYHQDNNGELAKLLREIGYQPTFYVLPETEVEAQISLSFSMSQESSSTSSASSALHQKMYKTQVNALPINAGNVNKFNLGGSAFAKIKFKVVPVPPPGSISELRIVPNLLQMTVKNAIDLLTSIGLTAQLADENASKNLTVKSQDPVAATHLKVGDVVRLVC